MLGCYGSALLLICFNSLSKRLCQNAAGSVRGIWNVIYINLKFKMISWQQCKSFHPLQLPCHRRHYEIQVSTTLRHALIRPCLWFDGRVPDLQKRNDPKKWVMEKVLLLETRFYLIWIFSVENRLGPILCAFIWTRNKKCNLIKGNNFGIPNIDFNTPTVKL